MTPSSAFISVLIPADLAEEFESRAWQDSLCAEETLIRLLTNWVNDSELKVCGVEIGRVESVHRTSGLRYGNKLRRCRNCGLRVPKALRKMPWKACSEDCAEELWIKANIADAELL
jgi:hypothetical protein